MMQYTHEAEFGREKYVVHGVVMYYVVMEHMFIPQPVSIMVEEERLCLVKCG